MGPAATWIACVLPARRWISRWESRHAEDMRRRFKRTVRRFAEMKNE
jgi:hypothetical protein